MSQEHASAIPVEFQGVRRKPDATGPRRYWKSLDELADAPAFLEFLHREFPEQASMFEDPKGRREFMTLMGASLALAGLTACTKQPVEKILPYVRQPEQLVPGRPLFFATATGHDGYARGILVESHEGRPTKVEGNPEHPASLGGVGRLRPGPRPGPLRPRSLEDRALHRRGSDLGRVPGGATRGAREAEGEGGGGPALPDRARDLADPRRPDGRRPRRLPAGEVGELGAGRARSTHGRGPCSPSGSRSRRSTASTRPTSCSASRPTSSRSHPASLRLVREFASRRKVSGERPEMNRLYVVEGSPTSTGASADHRLALRSSEIEGFARAVAAGLGVAGRGSGRAPPGPPRSRRT